MKITFFRTYRIVTYLLLLLSFNIYGQNSQEVNPEKQSLFSLILSEEKPTIEIDSDFKYLKTNRFKREYQTAKFTVKKSKKEEEYIWNHEAKIRTRGKFRCRTCEVPPLKIKFSKKELKEEGLKKANELKLVMKCKSELPDYQQYLYQEYLAYKLYNVLTDYSFNVQIVDLRLKDSKNKKKSSWQTAFLIEDEEELAKRLNVEVLDTIGIPKDDYLPIAYTRFQVFQFMIGNTDWLPTTCHNIQLIKNQENEIIPIPYDFDFSGMVSTHYSIPNSLTDLKNVRERYFLGNNKSGKELEIVFEEFRQKKDSLMGIINDFPYIEKRRKKMMLNYLDSFYGIIENDGFVKQYFTEKPVHLADRY
jgi:hypothetical protein